MTDAERVLLKSSVDQIVEVEMLDGDRHLAQVLFVFDEGETPDVFYLKVAPGSDGALVAQGSAGCSVLLDEIASVRPYSP
jgi:hypothetical protein